jgi:integrase
LALIEFLKKADDPVRVPTENILIGAWMEKFTHIEGNPRAARNVARNRPYSLSTVMRYEGLYRLYIKGDPFAGISMSEVEEADALEFISRIARRNMSRRDCTQDKLMGTISLEKIVKFLRMAFMEYQKTHSRWNNPFRNIEPPKSTRTGCRDALTEDEVVKLFGPGVLRDTMELAVCGAMFLAGLRRGEIFALKPEDLDWRTPKLIIRRAWQAFDHKIRELGPTKGKKDRIAPFDHILQEAIKKLWEENGEHEFVFSFKNGKTPGPSWIKGRFKKWLDRAGIEVGGRKIVPHSSRHSLASLLEARGTSLRYIQDLLGHSDLQTTKTYLHSTDQTIRDIGRKIESKINESKEGAENIVKIG